MGPRGRASGRWAARRSWRRGLRRAPHASTSPHGYAFGQNRFIPVTIPADRRCEGVWATRRDETGCAPYVRCRARWPPAAFVAARRSWGRGLRRAPMQTRPRTVTPSAKIDSSPTASSPIDDARNCGPRSRRRAPSSTRAGGAFGLRQQSCLFSIFQHANDRGETAFPLPEGQRHCRTPRALRAGTLAQTANIPRLHPIPEFRLPRTPTVRLKSTFAVAPDRFPRLRSPNSVRWFQHGEHVRKRGSLQSIYGPLEPHRGALVCGLL